VEEAVLQSKQKIQAGRRYGDDEIDFRITVFVLDGFGDIAPRSPIAKKVQGKVFIEERDANLGGFIKYGFYRVVDRPGGRRIPALLGEKNQDVLDRMVFVSIGRRAAKAGREEAH
jgi:hypothetical protein